MNVGQICARGIHGGTDIYNRKYLRYEQDTGYEQLTHIGGNVMQMHALVDETLFRFILSPT